MSVPFATNSRLTAYYTCADMSACAMNVLSSNGEDLDSAPYVGLSSETSFGLIGRECKSTNIVNLIQLKREQMSIVPKHPLEGILIGIQLIDECLTLDLN